MNNLVRKLIEHTEISADKSNPLLVMADSRPMEFYRCPHCKEEIHEKHIYMKEGIDHHSDCGGAIKWPPTDWSKVNPSLRKALEPYMKE